MVIGPAGQLAECLAKAYYYATIRYDTIIKKIIIAMTMFMVLSS